MLTPVVYPRVSAGTPVELNPVALSAQVPFLPTLARNLTVGGAPGQTALGCTFGMHKAKLLKRTHPIVMNSVTGIIMVAFA